MQHFVLIEAKVDSLRWNKRTQRLHRRHPSDRGWFSSWECVQIAYWTRATAHRRHSEPFAKSRRGLARRKLRKFVRKEEHFE